MVLDFLAVDNFDFTRKIVKKKIWLKNLGTCWGGLFEVDFEAIFGNSNLRSFKAF